MAVTIEYGPAATEDAELLVGIYNASFYDDYKIRRGPGIRKNKGDDGRVHKECPEAHHTV